MDTREIDRLIIEKVMSWREEFSDGDYDYFLIDDENIVVYSNEKRFSPSTSIQDAWMVIEKLREQGIFSSIRMHDDGTYEVSMHEFYDQDYQWLALRVLDRSAPLAICLAALKATSYN